MADSRRLLARHIAYLIALGLLLPQVASAGQFAEPTFNSPTTDHFQLVNGSVDISFEVEADNQFCVDSGETLDVTLETTDADQSVLDSEHFTFTGGRGNHTFDGAVTATAPGDYRLHARVALVAEQPGNDCSGGEAEGPVTVEGPPAARITAKRDETDPLKVSLDGSGSTVANGRTISDYEWDFGDGNTAHGDKVDHVYADGAARSVKLTTTDDQGGKLTTTLGLAACAS